MTRYALALLLVLGFAFGVYFALPVQAGLSGPGDGCTVHLEPSESSASLAIRQGCPPTQAFWQSLAQDSGVAAAFADRDRMYLGQTPVAGWPWPACAVMQALANSPDWTAEISNPRAAVVLEQVLETTPLSSDGVAVLGVAGLELGDVAIERVIFADSAAVSCPVMPVKVPTAADLDLELIRP